MTKIQIFLFNPDFDSGNIGQSIFEYTFSFSALIFDFNWADLIMNVNIQLVKPNKYDYYQQDHFYDTDIISNLL